MSTTPRPPAEDGIPDPAAWRAVVAGWPIARRQEWADLAERHQAAGKGWREAEWAAFREVAGERWRESLAWPDAGAEPSSEPPAVPRDPELARRITWPAPTAQEWLTGIEEGRRHNDSVRGRPGNPEPARAPEAGQPGPRRASPPPQVHTATDQDRIATPPRSRETSGTRGSPGRPARRDRAAMGPARATPDPLPPPGDWDAASILTALKASPHGMARSRIRRVVFHDHRPAEAVARALGTLLRHGLARSEAVPTPGRTAERWFAVSPGPTPA
jgi:hypothetical protein